jgi:hypothetical protein
MISFEPTMTAAILRIDTSRVDFKKKLSIGDARKLYNKLGGKTFCQCRKDCALTKNCKCIAHGRLCTSKCHSTGADGLPVTCSNCFTPAPGVLYTESNPKRSKKKRVARKGND